MLKIIRYILLFGPGFVWAQQPKDSLARQQAPDPALYYTDSVLRMQLDFARSAAYYLPSLMPQKASSAGIAYYREQGAFRAAQQASTRNEGQFYTEGSTLLGNLRLYGGLRYQRILEDSTAFAHQTRSNPTTPFYYGSPANVHYDRTRYTFDAMAAKSFLAERFELGLATQYTVGSHYSTNDPRGAIREFQFDLNGTLAYHLSAAAKIGIGYRHGYGRESVNIGYKNPRYYESSAFPVYYNHLVNGYREWDDALKLRVYDNTMQRDALKAYVDLHHPALGDIYLNGSYQKEKQHYFYSSSTGFVPYADYFPETFTIHGLWLKSLRTIAIGAQVGFQRIAGKDFNVNFKANNYLYTGKQSDFKFFIQQKSEKKQQYYALGLLQYSEERQDGISGNHVFYNQLYLSGTYSLQYTAAKGQTLGFGLEAGWQIPAKASFDVVPDEGYFTQYVINRDYLYHTASALSAGIRAAYGFPLPGTLKPELAIAWRYQNKLDEKTVPYIVNVQPGNTRFYSTIQFNLYF